MVNVLTPDQMAATHAAAFTQSRPWSAWEFSGLLDSPFTYAIGDQRSFALGRVVAGEAELLTIATHPDHQRQGLGKSALLKWMSEAIARFATDGFLDVASDNQAAQALYRSHGFAEAGRRTGYYPRQNAAAVDAVLMCVNLRKAQSAE
ncbi:GNAT family N-acetyltransferase [Phaeobacter porticola]|uniref:Putative acetyltransferase n=1 Tax=Phaeobacter porticola TaxID=1844006 RepID=A0A1L3I895_9RHOB|nr:GNAT family N-acetyltransferase [Phaeobacter porticola]APG48333.1 putative acetyltransferase [Phaeobacter porticola]